MAGAKEIVPFRILSLIAGIMTSFTRLSLALCIFAVALSGCRDSRPQRFAVSGHVYIDGKPLTYGTVTLVPKDARPSSGKLDGQGHFSLTCFGSQDGAVRGRHAVRVIAGKSMGGSSVRWYAPKKYADAKTSGLEVDIDGPTDSLRIDLTWAGQAAFVERAE
jgi:hypothetical protein